MNHQHDQEVVAGFISEAKGYLPEIMLGLESFAADATQHNSLKEAFRYAHIIKGAAAMLGFMQISEVAYQLEVTLEMLCEEHLPLSQELLEELCQNVSDLADLLDHSLADVPHKLAATPPATPLSIEPIASNSLALPELTLPEFSLPELSTDDLSAVELSIPDLLVPEQFIDPPLDAPVDAPVDTGVAASLESSFTPPLTDSVLPEISVPRAVYEESGETILLPSIEAEDNLLPEAHNAWADFSPSELAAIETEEPLVALLSETNFSVSLPEAAETPTIGDLDLNAVAQELKESFGAYPPPLQPEFALPDELMAGGLDLQFTPEPIAPPDETAAPVAQSEDVLAENSESIAPAAQEDFLPDLMPDLLPNIYDEVDATSATDRSFHDLPDQLAENLLPEVDASTEEVTVNSPAEPEVELSAMPTACANAVEGDTFIIESLTTETSTEQVAAQLETLPAEIEQQAGYEESEIAAPEIVVPEIEAAEIVATTLPEELESRPIEAEFQEFSDICAPTEEALPELLALPNLPELGGITEFDPPTLEDTLDAITSALEPVAEPVEEVASMPTPAAPTAPMPTLFTSSAISDDMAEELMETFMLEAEEHLQNLHTSLRVLYKNPNNRDLIQEVRRSSHSLKGTAAMVGLDNIMQLAHRMEDVLDLIYDGEMQLTQERTLLLMQATDALEDMSNGHSSTGEVQRLYSEFARLLASHTTDADETSSADMASETTVVDAPESVIDVATETLAETFVEAPELVADVAAETFVEPLPEWTVASETLIQTEEAALLPDSSIALPSWESEVHFDAAEPALASGPEAESLLPEWPLTMDEPNAPEAWLEPHLTTEPLLSEALIEAPEESAELSEVVSEPTGESTPETIVAAESEPLSESVSEPLTATISEPAVESVSETSAEPMVFTAPTISNEVAVEPATLAPAPVQMPAPVTVAEPIPAPAPTATVVHEPEVLPPTQTGTMAQTSSQFVRVPIERLDDIVKLISEMIITRTTFEQRLADFARQVEELQITGTRLRRASTNLESKYEVSTLGGGRPTFAPNNAPPGLSPSASLAASNLVNSLVTHNTYGFDDLEFDRYTEFHLVSRELVESSTDIQTLGRELNHLNTDFLSYLNRQGRIYSDLQDRLMRLRMVPLANLAPRLHRTVRTVSVQQRKEVELILEGETTAIDTTALQEMTDPLLHLLRNAVDHGIEAPDVRVAKGKDPLGKITLRAFYEGSQVVIQLRDNGQGINLNKIRQRALQQALITPAEAESMSPQELSALIFTPGFSTAAQVSEISGRGVGMDIVQTTVQKLKGTIIIDSQPNAGTTFTIRLPLTLAVTRSLMVKASGQTFAIPLDVVTQIMRLEMSKVERIGKEPVIRLGGKVYPLLMLSRLLNLRHSSDEVAERPPALLLSVEGKEVVVIIDQLMGGREVVIKTLGNHLRKIHGVMGATLMGDGEVVLILNLAELLRGTLRALPKRAQTNQTTGAESTSLTVALEAPATTESHPFIPAAPKPKTLNQTLTVMIVDDSPSVRRVSSNMIKNFGWLPVLAKDGLDALEQLQASETPPDLILLDIEMPRMDGYQFLGSIRALPAYRQLPVVIVSSRSSEKHRQKAFDLGATEYLVKPYQEDNVIALIRRLVQENQS